MNDFQKFAHAMKRHYEMMSQHELYKVDLDKDTLSDNYLMAFPEGSNPIYRVRAEHDCSCCKNYVRNIGNVVAIIDGQIVTVWDVEAEHPYDTVCGRMADLVRQHPIVTVHRTSQGQFGNELTREYTDEGDVKNWHHFVGYTATKHQSLEPDTVMSKYRSTAAVFRRGLEELTMEALYDVFSLINEGSLYRGDEYLDLVADFMALKAIFDKGEVNKEALVWGNVDRHAAGFRNSVIGTLVQDLSNGVELEDAVRMFESKVAPQNYKRPTALISKRMVSNAMEKIRELDLEPALERRMAKLSDVSVNNVLFVDNEVMGKMQDGVEGLLMNEVKPMKATKLSAAPITADVFLGEILPTSKRVSVLLENSDLANFVTLTAPVHADAGPLFKWDNGFGWSYDGDVTDSVKEKVKRAGGNVNAALRVSLAWFNYDDLDIHCDGPEGQHIYFQNKCGILDVDMNAGGRNTREPVENLAWTENLRDGVYKIWVHNYSRREAIDVGFMIEVEAGGFFAKYNHPKGLGHKLSQFVVAIEIKRGKIERVTPDPAMKGGDIPQEKWGVKTGNLVPVETIMLSPNHWDGKGIGHKHCIFALKGCKNPLPIRSIYNEFLKPELHDHRKVFEVLGSKTKCEVAEDQISGVGFSGARGDKVKVLVDSGKSSRLYEVTF